LRCGGLARRLARVSSDIRVAIFGPASADRARAAFPGELQCALPKTSFYAVHAEPALFFEPTNFFPR